jgi:hypothetical protein
MSSENLAAQEGVSNMTEIRVTWNVTGKTNKTGEPVQAGRWHPDSPANRKMLSVIVASCLAIYGAGTHWVEAREVELVVQ